MLTTGDQALGSYLLYGPDRYNAYQAASQGQHTLTILRARQRAAYLAAAQALHALIAVRTNQPMRILNQ